LRGYVLLAALSAIVIFGASPVAAKIAVVGMPAMDVALLRTVIGGMVALPLALLLRIRLPETTEQRWLLLVSGFCGFIAFPVLFTLGVNLTTANHASMILAALPIITGGIALAWDRNLPGRRWVIGCGIAFAGELVLIFGSGDARATAHQPSIAGDMLVLASNLFAALGYVCGGRLQRLGYPARATTFWGVAIFAVLALPILPWVIHTPELMAADTPSWLGLAYLAIGVTIVGYILWYWALGSGGIARVGTIQFLQPVSGVFLAFVLLGETLGLVFLFASAIILLGVWLAVDDKT